jgi:tryptophan synthase alpha chain
MGRIEEAFSRRAAEGKKTLVTYLCVGDPTEEESIDLALACVDAGADILELGCPFSDPTADGPAIARASQRALARGGGLAETLRVARAVRAKAPTVGIVLFGYYNPLFVRGEDLAAIEVARAGIDAVLVVDLPVDEAAGLRTTCAAQGVGVIPLVAPTTNDIRIARIAAVAKSSPVPFVYYVSMMGVTGGAGASDVLADAGAKAAHVRDLTGKPTVVGFGIDSPERARIAAREADGVVVGTAIVRRIEEGENPAARVESVRSFVASLRSAV